MLSGSQGARGKHEGICAAWPLALWAAGFELLRAVLTSFFSSAKTENPYGCEGFNRRRPNACVGFSLTGAERVRGVCSRDFQSFPFVSYGRRAGPNACEGFVPARHRENPYACEGFSFHKPLAGVRVYVEQKFFYETEFSGAGGLSSPALRAEIQRGGEDT